jgi:type I restriction enzyme S subunit
MVNLNQGVLLGLPIEVPPLAEQQRIADKLDTVLARVGACRDRLARVAPLLKRFRQSVLAAATSGRLTEDWRTQREASPWAEMQIQSVAEIGTGSTPLRSNAEYFAAIGTPWITSGSTSRPFVDSADEFVTDAAVKAHRLRVYPPGTLLVAMYGEGKTRGQVTELRIAATINQACAAVRVDESVARVGYVKLVLQANYYEMRELAEGGNQPNLNLSKIKEFGLKIPGFAEQAEIVRRVDLLFDFAERLEARLNQAQTAVDRLTPSLLAKAFRGELVPQDPADEPAAELLKRLAARREAEPARPRRRRAPA